MVFLENADCNANDIVYEPMTKEELKKIVPDENGDRVVSGVVIVHIMDMVDKSAKDYYELLSMKLIGSTTLKDIDDVVVGAYNNANILVEVSGIL